MHNTNISENKGETVSLVKVVFFVFVCMSAYQIVRLAALDRVGCEYPSVVTVRTLAAVQSY